VYKRGDLLAGQSARDTFGNLLLARAERVGCLGPVDAFVGERVVDGRVGGECRAGAANIEIGW